VQWQLGIVSPGQFKFTSGTINGRVDFAGPINYSGNTPSGGYFGNVAAVTSAWNTMTSLASTLGAESGTAINLGQT